MHEKVTNDASARPPNLTSVSQYLDLWPPVCQSWSFHTFTLQTTCAVLQQIRFVRFKTSRSQDWQQTKAN